jgi:hypothetical protein
MLRPTWIEIPVQDLCRAMDFYQTVFDLEPTGIVADNTHYKATLLHFTPEGVSEFSLNQPADFEPCDHGAPLHLRVVGDVDEHLSRIEAAGGRIVESNITTLEGMDDYYATCLDTEGNLLALSA